MTLKEANLLLDQAPADSKPSRINRFLTRQAAVKLVRDGINAPNRRTGVPDDPLDDIMEKRVLQVAQDRVRPKRNTVPAKEGVA